MSEDRRLDYIDHMLVSDKLASGWINLLNASRR